MAEQELKAQAMELVEDAQAPWGISVAVVLQWLYSLGKDQICPRRAEIEDAADAAVERIASRIRRPILRRIVTSTALWLVDSLLDEMCGPDVGDED